MVLNINCGTHTSHGTETRIHTVNIAAAGERDLKRRCTARLGRGWPRGGQPQIHHSDTGGGEYFQRVSEMEGSLLVVQMVVEGLRAIMIPSSDSYITIYSSFQVVSASAGKCHSSQITWMPNFEDL